MKRSLMILVVLVACLIVRCVATQVSVFADNTPTPAALERPVTIGGGVKRPWTSPYKLASLNSQEPTAFAMVSMSAVTLLIYRRATKRQRRSVV